MNQQREVIYSRRRELMETPEPEAFAGEYIEEIVAEVFAPLEAAKEGPDPESLDAAKAQIEDLFNLRPEITTGAAEEKEMVLAAARGRLEALAASAGDQAKEIIRYFLLDALDRYWKEHLLSMPAMMRTISARIIHQSQRLMYFCGLRRLMARPLARTKQRLVAPSVNTLWTNGLSGHKYIISKPLATQL